LNGNKLTIIKVIAVSNAHPQSPHLRALGGNAETEDKMNLAEKIKNNPPSVGHHNKRPDFNDSQEARFFEKTPKRELFNMLRDASELLVSLQVDGYESGDKPELWIWQSKNVGCSLPE